jgi:hypothetical protein
MDFTWIANDQGDITNIAVTSPITGGGSAGAVTIGINAATTSVVGAVQLSDSTSTTSSVLASTPTATKSAYDLAAGAVPKSTVTTAGDIIYATGSGAVTRLGIGSTGQVLKVAAGVPSWGTDAAGKVLQVVSATTSTAVSNSTNTFADTGLTATITPSSATSKVLVIFSQNGVSKNTGNTQSRISLRLMRGATNISSVGDYFLYDGTNLEIVGETISGNVLDAPATTSATTYKTQFMNPANAANVSVQLLNTHNSTITLLEIGA